MLVMGDQVSAVKIGALACIILGFIGLNLAGGGH
jgi:quaternary ammonium compound-resistance protein SugE